MSAGESPIAFDAAHVAVYKDPNHPLLVKAGNSLRKRIDLMCRSCITDELDRGTWRQQVEGCKCNYCPLWAVRPVSQPRGVQKIGSRADGSPQKAVFSTQRVVHGQPPAR